MNENVSGFNNPNPSPNPSPNLPPIPSPSAGNCRSCGASVDDGRARFCARCGAALQSDAPVVSGLKIFGAICLGLLALPLAGLGACFLIISPFTLSGSTGWRDAGPIFGIAFVALGLAAACIWGIVKLMKR